MKQTPIGVALEQGVMVTEELLTAGTISWGWSKLCSMTWRNLQTVFRPFRRHLLPGQTSLLWKLSLKEKKIFYSPTTFVVQIILVFLKNEYRRLKWYFLSNEDDFIRLITYESSTYQRGRLGVISIALAVDIYMCKLCLLVLMTSRSSYGHRFGPFNTHHLIWSNSHPESDAQTYMCKLHELR